MVFSSKRQIIECVPNFSEGQDESVIQGIAKVIENVSDVKLLHIDRGYTANRTVFTFAGSPLQVIEAAFLAVKKAAETINMAYHKGVHPRIGATDVLPLIPVTGISMEETVKLSYKLAQRIGDELGIPVYCYENSARFEDRRKLENIRKGGYEGLSEKIMDEEWTPDFGPREFNTCSGATILGAREFLVAYNVNLDTTSELIATKIAGEIRESGHSTIVDGNLTIVPGLLPTVKAIGWYIDEYKMAQVSTNLTNINTVPVHAVYETVKEVAKKYNVNVTGSEIIGLVPLSVLTAAGMFYAETDLHDKDLINIAIDRLGLRSVSDFKPEERILDYLV